MPGFARDDARYLDPAQDLDGVLAGLLELASQLWVVLDRQAVVEHLLDARGVVTRSDVDDFVPEGDLARKLEEQREQFTRRLLDAVARRGGLPA